MSHSFSDVDVLVKTSVMCLLHAACCTQGNQEFQLDPLLEEHNALMERINSWNFQIFDLVDRTGGKTGRILSYVRSSLQTFTFYFIF